MSQTTPEDSSANGATTPTLRSSISNGHGRPVPHTVLSPIHPAERSIWERNDSHLVAVFAFVTGIVYAASIALAIVHMTTPQCWLYVTSLAFFHFMEYYITAKYKPFDVTLDAFLYNNGRKYVMAQTLGFAEFLLEWYFWPHTKIISVTTYAGLALLVIGQFFRSAAMIEASSNFSHQIATEKKSSHELVTSGVYSLVRHPSYFGFFWWSVGTQVFLANPLSTVVFMAVLWRFFSARIQ